METVSKQKQDLRDKINKDIEKYLSNGGGIDKLKGFEDLKLDYAPAKTNDMIH